MADPQVYPEIPNPSPDPQALLAVITALKDVVETLLGKRGIVGWSNQCYVQRDTPRAVRTGDLWVRPATLKGEFDKLSFWDGTQWRLMKFS